MSEPDTRGGIDEDAGIIRPAVRHRVGHGPRGGLRRFGRGHPVRVEETRYAAQSPSLRPFNAPPAASRQPHLPNTPMLYSQRRRSWHRRCRASPSPHRSLRWGEGWGEGQVLAPAVRFLRLAIVHGARRPRMPLPLTLALSPRREERRGERDARIPSTAPRENAPLSPPSLCVGEGTVASPAPCERGRARCARQKDFPSARLNPFSPAAPRPRRARAGENARCRRGRSGRAPRTRNGSRLPWRPVRPDASGWRRRAA